MINILLMVFFMSMLKFLVEENLLALLLIMESLVISLFFMIISLNLEMVSLNSIAVTLLTLQVSESVLSLGMFVNMMRFSSSEKVMSLKMLKF